MSGSVNRVILVGALRQLGVSDVIHFTGGRLHREAESCAAEVQAALAGARTRPIRLNPQPLDKSQQRAAAHGRGAARVLAPAGSGKTRTMVHRVATLIERGVDPAQSWCSPSTARRRSSSSTT